MARDTGFPAADAQSDFLRARRERALARLAARLRREPGDVRLILPFDEVVDALGRLGERALGLQSSRSTRSSGRSTATRDFDRRFRPTTGRVRAALGAHRAGHAPRRGDAADLASTGSATCTSCATATTACRSPARSGLTTSTPTSPRSHARRGAGLAVRLPTCRSRATSGVFAERVPLPPEARERVRLSDPWDYAVLAEGVEAWGFRAMQDAASCWTASRSRRWFDEEYGPVVAHAARGRHDRARHRDRRVHARGRRALPPPAHPRVERRGARAAQGQRRSARPGAGRCRCRRSGAGPRTGRRGGSWRRRATAPPPGPARPCDAASRRATTCEPPPAEGTSAAPASAASSCSSRLRRRPRPRGEVARRAPSPSTRARRSSRVNVAPRAWRSPTSDGVLEVLGPDAGDQLARRARLPERCAQLLGQRDVGHRQLDACRPRPSPGRKFIAGEPMKPGDEQVDGCVVELRRRADLLQHAARA